MQRVLIAETVQKIDKEVIINGFVKIRRDHGKLIFLDVEDRSGLVQVVVNPGVSDKAYKIAQTLRSEFTVEIIGKVNKRFGKTVNKDLKTGTVEIQATKIVVLSVSEVLPFDMGGKVLDLELPTLLDYRSLTLRHQTVKEIFKVQEVIADAFREISKKLQCTEIFIPTIAASATEGGAEVFMVDYFGHKVYLTQSPQLYKQMMVPVFERVFTIAHAYRAEPSVTTRHLTESTQMDCEFGFVDFETLLDFLELAGTEMLKSVNEKCKHTLELFGVKPVSFGKIPRLTLRKAQEIIFKETGRDNRKEKDMTPQDEIDICKWARKKYKTDLVTITHFPTSSKPFYIMPDSKDSQYSLSYDLLFRGIEILSGSQRINDYKQLFNNIMSRGMDPKNFAMYLQAFKYGMPPEGGFSFGLERLTMKVLELQNVRQASLYPRDMERVDQRFSKMEQKKTK